MPENDERQPENRGRLQLKHHHAGLRENRRNKVNSPQF
jgi:hypothetical protein